MECSVGGTTTLDRECEVLTNSNNTAPSIGTIAGCNDQREHNIKTGLFGLGIDRENLPFSNINMFVSFPFSHDTSS